jgi:hypothetical protein
MFRITESKRAGLTDWFKWCLEHGGLKGSAQHPEYRFERGASDGYCQRGRDQPRPDGHDLRHLVLQALDSRFAGGLLQCSRLRSQGNE